ncbi:delta(8)-fatty-acid desaturase 1-like [Dorcoceras hygrometricum]|uniref:Delta(8)-fatty-acid desaturase 1-like n=1 Tax=Dorcoceras hygrometricum TaxID=472368 RepID=A0A2Z6ZU50_9LAMI|nr:delta(8)-fatty-acid desaturase 1-like [Dorcoceras hygrometricum]
MPLNDPDHLGKLNGHLDWLNDHFGCQGQSLRMSGCLHPDRSMKILSTVEKHWYTDRGPTSGPDLDYRYSYTSILRLGLAARDTPDAPH